ncbi:MAG: hypothetical protein JWL98_723 [Xanthomonadaceae bacterium]|nr:hypothetical protein [Xanthomonadaceae bacterium]
MTADHIHRAIEAVWRMESARVVGALVRMMRDVGLAEELAQDALVAALEHWPRSGIPDNPAAWLMSTARRRAIDRLRRSKRWQQKQAELAFELHNARDDAIAGDDGDQPIDDDVLRLIFIACHPVLSPQAQVALTLRLLGGLATDEIARANLVPEPTIAQRIVRAKRTLANARVPFEVPRGADLAARLSSVLAVVYLIFNEGYSATTGDNWMRPRLCEEALRLGRVLVALAPDQAEVHGLAALMELQASRMHARTSPSGEPILLLDQDLARWDQLLIRRGVAALDRAAALGGAHGPYALQAAIAAFHARAIDAAATDWSGIAAVYDELAAQTGSPVVALNRAVAIAMAQGPAVGLALVDGLGSEPALQRYHLLPSVRGDLLQKLGRVDEAAIEFQRAAALTRNGRERALLLGRAAACAPGM